MSKALARKKALETGLAFHFVQGTDKEFDRIDQLTAEDQEKLSVYQLNEAHYEQPRKQRVERKSIPTKKDRQIRLLLLFLCLL